MAEVSVIIPCYNGQQFIAATIESVLTQSDLPREVFVIDDGSTDDSAAIVERYVHQSESSDHCRITLIRQANAGESRARNVGIERATCPFIAFLDADDLWTPHKTRLQIEAFEQSPNAVGVHTRVFNFKDNPDDLDRAETEQTKDNPSVSDLISYHYIAPSSAMIRRDVLRDRSIRFDEAVRHSEDMLFLAEACLAGPFRLVDELLVGKRIHAGQQTKNPWHTIYSLESRVGWCRDHAQQLGPEVFEQLDAELGQRMIDTLVDRYWRRQVRGFKAHRSRVAKLFPDEVVRHKVINHPIYPRWVYRLRDALSRRQVAPDD